MLPKNANTAKGSIFLKWVTDIFNFFAYVIKTQKILNFYYKVRFFSTLKSINFVATDRIFNYVPVFRYVPLNLFILQTAVNMKRVHEFIDKAKQILVGYIAATIGESDFEVELINVIR